MAITVDPVNKNQSDESTALKWPREIQQMNSNEVLGFVNNQIWIFDKNNYANYYSKSYLIFVLIRENSFLSIRYQEYCFLCWSWYEYTACRCCNSLIMVIDLWCSRNKDGVGEKSISRQRNYNFDRLWYFQKKGKFLKR